MKLLDSLKSMFINKDEVSKVKMKKIETNFIYINDRMFIVNGEGSTIWLITFKHDDYVEFLQIAEVLPFNRWKTYPFKDSTVILVSLTISDMKYMFDKCRFINNPILTKLKQDIHSSIVRDFAVKIGEDFQDYEYLRTDIHSHYITFDNEDENIESERDWDNPPYLEGLRCETAKILEYDNINNVMKYISYAIPQIIPYFTTADIVDLARISYEMKTGTNIKLTPTNTYRYFLNSIFERVNNQDKYKSKLDSCYLDLYYLLKSSDKISLAMYESMSSIVKLDTKSLDEEVDNTPIDEVITDTSNVPEENWIKDTNLKGEDNNV